MSELQNKLDKVISDIEKRIANKEDKKTLSANSIASALAKIGIILGITLPIEKAIK